MTRESLADREVVYRKLIEAAPDAIVIANQEGSIVLVNAQAEKIFGYKRTELLDQSIEILVPEKMRGKHRFHRAGYMSGPVSRPTETDLQLYGLRKDGTEFPAEISLSPIQTPSGWLIASAIRDVTERNRAKQRIVTLLDSAPDAMVVVGEDGRIVLVNTQTERLFGYERTELLGQPVEALIPERFWAGHRDHRARYRAHPQVRPMGAGLELYGMRKDGGEFPVEIEQLGARKQFSRHEAHLRRKDGKVVTVELGGRAVSDDAGSLLYFEVIVEDVSHQRGVEHRLRHVQKMEAIGRLAGGIAHDFNNVLGVITGYSEMLVDRLGRIPPYWLWLNMFLMLRNEARHAQRRESQH